MRLLGLAAALCLQASLFAVSPIFAASPLIGAAPALIGAAPSSPLPAPPVQGVPAAAPAAVIVDSRTGAAFNESELLDRLAAADIVYAGESHDNAAHHKIQAALLAGLGARRPNLSVGLEMIPAEDQPTLDAFMAGRMSEDDFKEFWKKAWGFDYAIYKPIFDAAKAANVPVRGLNAPRKIISKIAKTGLASLTPEERAALPAAVNPITDPRYLAYVKKSFEGHGPMTPERLARMLEAQAAWNETMAANALAAGGPILVIAGTGHMIYGAGIAESVRSRSQASQAVVLPYPDGGAARPVADLLRELRDPASSERSNADYFWLLPGS